MFQFDYATQDIEQLINQGWDCELDNELKSVLKILKQCGEIAGANVGRNPLISASMFELKGKTFYLVYSVFPERKLVKFYDFKLVAHSIDWKAKLDLEIENVENEIYIPQTGDPTVITNTLKMIYKGEDTPYKLGLAVGSTAKKEKDIARRGQYVGKCIVQLGLAKAIKSTNVPTIYQLNDPIFSAIKREDEDTIQRLIAEGLLGFAPVQQAIYETTKGEEELTIELIETIFKRLKITELGGTTSPRRARSIRALTMWVSRMAGIPIRRQGQKHLQPYIPFIYAE